MTINWKGKELKKRVDRAIAKGINETMVEAVKHAIKVHPQWIYRTGLAEGSIDIKEFATIKKLVGLWGSIWPHAQGNYVWWLEFKHGSFLRKAADATYKNLTKRIKAHIK